MRPAATSSIIVRTSLPRAGDLPLLAACVMRIALAHGYFKVDLEIVWKTIQTDLLKLHNTLLVIARHIKENDRSR